jgi:hypothetical protein
MKHMFGVFGLLILAAVGVSWAATTPTTPTIRQILTECPDWDHAMACPGAVRDFIAGRVPSTDQTDRQMGSLAVQLVKALENQKGGIPRDVCDDVATGIHILAKAMNSPGQMALLENIALDLCNDTVTTAGIDPPNGNGGNENGGGGNENGGGGNENGGNENGGNENGGGGNSSSSSSSSEQSSSSSEQSSSSSSSSEQSSSSSSSSEENGGCKEEDDDDGNCGNGNDDDRCDNDNGPGCVSSSSSQSSSSSEENGGCKEEDDDDGNCGNGNDDDRCDNDNGPGCESSSAASSEPLVCDEGEHEEDGKCKKDKDDESSSAPLS